MNPVGIYFDNTSVNVGNQHMSWEQAIDLSKRLEVLTRYHSLYMQEIEELGLDG